jgi:HK97 family phage major capsid protein
MSVEKLHDLEQKRDNIARQMRSLNETIGDGDWSEDQRTNFRSMQSELGDLDDKISMAKEMRRLDAEDAKHQAQQEHEERARHDAAGGDEKRYGEIFEKSMRFGFAELTREERDIMKRAGQNTGTDSAGGYTVPTDFNSRVIEAMKAYGGVANNCQVMNTTDGRAIEWSTTDGTADMGAFIAEATKATTQDVVFGQKTIGAKKLTSNVILISNELLQDTGIAMDSLLVNRIGTRIGRKEADAIVNGTGTGLENSGLDKQVTAKTNIATAAAVNWKDINKLVHSVDPAYRGVAKLAFNDATFALLKEQEDSQGRPLWLPSVAGMAPSTILGEQYFIDQAIANAASTNKFMYYGDFNKFILRRVRYMQLKRLNELYAESDQVGFLAFHRFDTLLEDTSAIKALAWKTS